MKNMTCLMLLLLPLVSASVVAQQQQPPAPAPATPPPAMQPSAAQPGMSSASRRMTPLDPDVQFSDLIASIERRTGQRFLVQGWVPQQIYLGGISVDDVDYPQFLLILRNHDLMAMESDGWVNITQVIDARMMPTRVISLDTPDVPRDEVVTLTIPTRNVDAAELVPVLRSLVSRWGHLAAAGNTPRQLLIVEYYDNAMRIAAIVQQLDR